MSWGVYVLGGKCQEVSFQGVSDRGVCVLGVSVRGVHVRGGGGLCPIRIITYNARMIHQGATYIINIADPPLPYIGGGLV